MFVFIFWWNTSEQHSLNLLQALDISCDSCAGVGHCSRRQVQKEEAASDKIPFFQENTKTRAVLGLSPLLELI